ncbi:hypothetical protein H4J02_06850 [Protaetiibacter sp. SSC-01]|uniref:hypothetical protein n=1 Tax=Protaetiibacter sp. SSC-01 TaxID=2759943 RepID=UPI0016570D91|nr:hypothetical protein [Protaetiibacter sp. SSC-01]QNO38700.1 hypothetical protein H4J02_06850 [Protaetiibacter sp. SSC-01]
MELPELFSSDALTSLAITAGLVAVGFLLLWLVIRSAVLSALRAHEKRRARDAAVAGPRRTGAEAAPSRTDAGERQASADALAPRTADGAAIVSISPSAPGAPLAPVAQPTGALAPPTGIAQPVAPYATTPYASANALQDPAPVPQRPQVQPNAAAAAAALFQSRPAETTNAQAPAPQLLTPQAAPAQPPVPQQAPAPQEAPVPQQAPAQQQAPVPQQQQAQPSLTQPRHPPTPSGQPVTPQAPPPVVAQTPAQPPMTPAGQHSVMSASDPAWAPPVSAAANPFHVTGDAPVPAPYERPVADPHTPRRF